LTVLGFGRLDQWWLHRSVRDAARSYQAVLESEEQLRLVNMVPMLDNRTVVPLKLRGQVLETLHSAH
jgi:hypothetical protein